MKPQRRKIKKICFSSVKKSAYSTRISYLPPSFKEMGPIVCYAECLGTEAPGLHVPAYRLPVSPEMLQKCENSYVDRKCY